MDKFGATGTNPGDFVYYYEDTPDGIMVLDEDDEYVKSKTKNDNDKVVKSAHYKRNFLRAKAIMDALGYSKQEFSAMDGLDA